ncbi:MAG TPA: PaaI family thioesterase [Burkholderiaceae bacterium]|nr:PaaI family thioesterase [Burkholderiaceae bacterium]
MIETKSPLPPYCTEDRPYFGLDIPFMRYLGLQAEHIEEGYARARLPDHPSLVNSREDIHGGTLMSVLDFIMSAAARGHDPLNLGVATIEMSTHFLEVARGELVFEAHTLKRGRSTAFCEGKAVNADGTTVCVARAAFRLIQLTKS